MPADLGQDGSLEPPRISVVICAFTLERSELLAKALESLGRQTVPPFEVILVADHAPQLEAVSQRRWPEIKVVPNREQQGLSGARNTGLAESSGEVIAFIDDDAVAAPDWIERLGRAYGDPGVVGVGGTVRPIWETGRPGWFPAEFDWVVGCTHSGMPDRRQGVRNLVGANMSFRREALQEVGGFRHELGRIGTIPAGCEETDLCIRVGKRWPGATILYDPDVAVDHFVPSARGRPGYFASRCRAEGRSKAILAGLVGAESGLSDERGYARQTLPRGVARDLGDSLRGDPAGVARAATIAFGLLSTTVGYLGGRREGRRLARRQGRGADRDPKRPSVLMVTPRSPVAQGGVERHVMEVSKRIAAAGSEVQVLCTEPGGPTLAEEKREGVVIRTVRAWPANRDYCFAPSLWREIGRRRWDVIHIQSYHTLVAPLAMLRALTLGVPYVVTFHGGGHSSRLRNRARRFQRLLLRPLLARAARLVAVARFEIDAYGGELHIPADRFCLIPNGTDLAFARNGDLPPPPNGRPTIATIGRLERYKGHHRVIAAFPTVLESEPDARLLVVGTGPYEGELRRQVAELGLQDRVEFTSTSPEDPGEMATLLRGVSLVVLLSEFETHPLVALESAAAGRRLLVADSGGLAELAEDGLARSIAVDETPAAVGQAVIEELVRPPSDHRPQLISWDECAGRLQDLYRSLA